MAFLSAGHVPGEGKYGDTIKKGVEWVLNQQQANGLIATERHYEMYHHGICTLMLTEVAGKKDSKNDDAFRKKLVKAVDLILKAQRPQNKGEARGGWRYSAEPVRGSDISVTGWQIRALREAKSLGYDVPYEAIKNAVAYIQRSQDYKTGAFQYAVHEGGRTTIACTGTAILALELCGKDMHGSKELLRAGDYLLKQNPPWGLEQVSYSMYYCSKACFQLAGNYWKEFKPLMHKHLLAAQDKSGAWKGDRIEERSFGPNYCTSMAVLALTAERSRKPESGDGKEKTGG
jgi:hypothetical protein